MKLELKLPTSPQISFRNAIILFAYLCFVMDVLLTQNLLLNC